MEQIDEGAIQILLDPFLAYFQPPSPHDATFLFSPKYKTINSSSSKRETIVQ